MLFTPPSDMKMVWPECQGKTAEEARDMIISEYPDVHIQILTEHSPATMDYRMDRVRIITNNDNVVLMARRG